MYGCIQSKIFSTSSHRRSLLWLWFPTHVVHGISWTSTEKKSQPIRTQVNLFTFIFIYLGKIMIYCGWWMDNLCQNIKNDLPFISYIPSKTINIARNIVSWYHLTSHLVIHLVCYLDYMDSKFIQWVTKYKHKHKPQLPKEEAHPRDSDLQRLVMYLANTWYLSSSAAHSLVNGLLLYSSSTTSWLYIGKHLTSLLTFTDCNPFSFSLFFKHLAK